MDRLALMLSLEGLPSGKVFETLLVEVNPRRMVRDMVMSP